MTSIFSPRRTKSSAKGGPVEPAPEAPATLATAHAAAFVKAKRDGDLLLTTHVEERKGKEVEHIVQILRFPMKASGDLVAQKVIDEFKLDKKKSEKFVPYFPRGGVYMDLTRSLDQYVMGTTETLHLEAFKKPRGTLLVILYEMGKVEQIDVWSKTTVLGVLMSITAKTENTVNECILCTPEPVQELSLDLVVPKTLQKMVFLKRSRVTDKVPPQPLFPSRQYLIEQFNAKFQSTMYVPQDAPPSSSSSPALPEIEPEKPAYAEPTPEPVKPIAIDVSAFVNVTAPTTPAPAHHYTRGNDEAAVAEDDDEDGDGRRSPAAHQRMQSDASLSSSAHSAHNSGSSPNLTSAPAASLSPRPVAASPTTAPASSSAGSTAAAASPAAPARDVKAELAAEQDATRRYARLIELLESEPIPEPRVVAATFKEWFTRDAQFKAYFNALGAVRVASLLKNVANALKA